MANTTNFGWETPDDTDLVKDGAAAMRTLGNAIDTSLVDLKGGTTDQVLAKNSNTDMDFKWVTTDDANAIQNAIVDAKGDLIAASAADTPARLAVGSNGDTLVADSSATTGLRWQETYAAGKNKIINGNMAIDQRNGGAAVTVNTADAKYPVDRFFGVGQATDGVFTLQRDSNAPSGFNYSVKATVTTADASIGSTQFYLFRHNIEGNQIYDLGWGASGAKTVTLSFWVRSSVTGTFGGSIRNTGTIVSYPFSYSITTADTWEKKTITIAGDTSGTWTTTEALGIQIAWSLGDGSSRLGTAGSWVAASYSGVTGQTNLISTLNATWYITGVQLEIGSAGTGFTLAGGNIAGELALAQRYYWKVASGAVNLAIANVGYLSATDVRGTIQFPVTMRTTPIISAASGTNYYLVERNGGTDAIDSLAIVRATDTACVLYNNTEATGTAGHAGYLVTNNASASVAFSAEL